MLESDFTEGLRVVLTSPIHTLFIEMSERAEPDRKFYPKVAVPYPNGRGSTQLDYLDVVPADTKGTAYQFRIRDGRPTSGFKHPRMWGVKFDGYPTGLSGHMGVGATKNYELAGEELDPALASLLKDWLAAEQIAERIEGELSKAYSSLPSRVYTSDGIRAMHETYKPFRAEADRLRLVYDSTSNIPTRRY